MSKLQYEVFLRSAQFESAAADTRMRPVDWRLLLALDGLATLDEVAARTSLDIEDAVDTISLCERLGLVERRRVLLAEYRSAFAPRLAPAAPAPEAALAQPEARAAEAERPVEFAAQSATEEPQTWAEAEPEAAEAAGALAEAPFPVLSPERHIADLPLNVIPTPEPVWPEAELPAPAPETPQLAAAAPKPIEFKLRPSVQVVIR
jgi:hypothetical protein